MENQENSAIVQDKNIYNKKTKAKPKPIPNIGIEDNHDIVSDILESESSRLDMSVFNEFLAASRTRDKQYKIIDDMCEDSILATALELYAENATETNENKQSVWVTSDDSDIAKTVQFLLDSIQVDKNIYKWALSFIKYGNLYWKLYRKSEYEPDLLFQEEKKPLNEDLKLNIAGNNDPYVYYVEAMDNPAECFELVRYGKTAGFIKTDIEATPTTTNIQSAFYQYSFNKNDIEIYQPSEFVHCSLDDNVDRVKEEVKIFIDSNDEEKAATYKVKSGQPIFYPLFRIWRMISLLENSLLLNRVTKSSITRIIQIETGDTAKEETSQILQSVKSMIEQKMALNPGVGMAEYTNPGPMENNIYMPTHDGKGNITTAQIGGDVNVGQLSDVDYFKNKFYGALGIPKQFLGDTNDSTGFNGGTSLTIISSQFAKKIKKIQNALCQGLTTIVNLYLMDMGLSKYLNKFTINMLSPTTQEDIDRKADKINSIQVVSDIMNLLSDIENNTTKLKILKTLISSVVNDSEIIDLIEQEIEKLESEQDTVNKEEMTNDEDSENESSNNSDLSRPLNLDRTLGLGNEESEEEITTETETETGSEDEEGINLPTPEETGIDLTQNV